MIRTAITKTTLISLALVVALGCDDGDDTGLDGDGAGAGSGSVGGSGASPGGGGIPGLGPDSFWCVREAPDFAFVRAAAWSEIEGGAAPSNAYRYTEAYIHRNAERQFFLVSIEANRTVAAVARDTISMGFVSGIQIDATGLDATPPETRYDYRLNFNPAGATCNAQPAAFSGAGDEVVLGPYLYFVIGKLDTYDLGHDGFALTEISAFDTPMTYEGLDCVEYTDTTPYEAGFSTSVSRTACLGQSVCAEVFTEDVTEMRGGRVETERTQLLEVDTSEFDLAVFDTLPEDMMCGLANPLLGATPDMHYPDFAGFEARRDAWFASVGAGE